MCADMCLHAYLHTRFCIFDGDESGLESLKLQPVEGQETPPQNQTLCRLLVSFKSFLLIRDLCKTISWAFLRAAGP